MFGRVVHNQYRHCIRGWQFRTAYNFSHFSIKCDKFAFLIRDYVTMYARSIVNSVNKIKRLFRKYDALNVNEAFLFFFIISRHQ